jgi:hypothetical protein
MAAKHLGVLIGIIVLISLSVICHISKMLDVKSQFTNVNTSNRMFYYGGSNNTRKYCPGNHPYIPCRLVKKCQATGAGPVLSEEDQAVLDKYVYLSGLLRGVDFFNFKNPDTWFI